MHALITSLPSFPLPDNTLFSLCLHLRTFGRKCSNIDVFLKILPLKDDRFSDARNVTKMGGYRLRFGDNIPGKTPKSE